MCPTNKSLVPVQKYVLCSDCDGFINEESAGSFQFTEPVLSSSPIIHLHIVIYYYKVHVKFSGAYITHSIYSFFFCVEGKNQPINGYIIYIYNM